MTNVKEIYSALAVRINYPVQPTFRSLQKVIGYINLLLSLSNAPQVIIEVPLGGQPRKRTYKKEGEKIAYLTDGKPCKINPDGTINTPDKTAFVIRTALFEDINSGLPKNFVDSDTDVLSDDYYLQPLLTSLLLIFQGVAPIEAVSYLNDACTKSFAKVETKQINLNTVRKRL